jgi:hypothetical protein
MGARGLVAWLVLVNLAMGVSAAFDQAGVPVSTAGGNPPACSRERSRHARGVLDDFFHPVADRNRFRLPPNCPFDRSKDMYLEHEKHKEVVRRTQYKSLYSDKTFYSEHYVDKHMDNRHMDKVPPGADVCLADYCEVLRCDEHQAWKHPELRKTIGSSASRARCSEEKMRGVRHFCEVLMSRCFPTSGVDDGGAVTAARLREYFTRHHCDMLTCDGVHDMFGVLGSHHAVSGGGGYALVLIVVFGAVGVYYVFVWNAVRDGRRSVDLRRARKETVGTRAERWLVAVSKKLPFSKRLKKKLY